MASQEALHDALQPTMRLLAGNRDLVSEAQYRRLDKLAEEDPSARVVGIDVLDTESATVLVHRSSGRRQSVLPNGRIGNRGPRRPHASS